ncbi:ribonucleoside-diphosphate reductase small chain, putative, partial [Leishmania donovani]
MPSTEANLQPAAKRPREEDVEAEVACTPTDGAATDAAKTENLVMKPVAAGAEVLTADKVAEGTNAEEEPLQQENPFRYVLFPIQYHDIWRKYKEQESCIWTVEEIDLGNDMKDWATLNDGERHFIKHVLAFFAGSDGIVIENLAQRFMSDVKVPEARAFYGFQLMMENIHSETYSVLLDTYITDSEEKLRLLHAIQ